MKKIIFTILTIFAALTIQAQEAQNIKQSEKDAKAVATQLENIIQYYEISDEIKDEFSKIYTDWQKERNAAIMDERQENVTDEISYKKLTDDEAKELLQKTFERKLKQVEVDKNYYTKLKSILPADQAAQLVVQQRNQTAGFISGMGGGRGMGGFGGGMPFGGGGMFF